MRIVIIGLGLIGGSIGLALKKKNWQQASIVGYVRKLEVGELAVEMGAVDRFELNLIKAIRGSDMIIIATPVLTIKDLLAEIAPHLRSDCIVTDTASTKSQVMNWAEKLLPSSVNFVGGHPMAGKEIFGIKAADANLFTDRVYCIMQSPHNNPVAVQTVSDMVQNLGAVPQYLNANDHDKLVAGISHLPFLLSAALTLVTTKNDSWPKMSQLASSGYRDLTRLASGNPEINASICNTNQSAIVYWIDEFIKELQKLRSSVKKDDKEIGTALTIAHEARRKWLETH
jgi:prephenate dehydrogenase